MVTRREFMRGIAAAGTAAMVYIQPGMSDSFSQVGAKVDRSARRGAIKPSAIVQSLKRREDTVLRYSGNGDNWHMSWAADDRQYVSLCDGAGFSMPPKVSYNSRMLAISGDPHNAQFHDLANYPFLGRPSQKWNDARYYNFGTLALDGYLYQFLSTFDRPYDPQTTLHEEPLHFAGVKLIYSPDNGLTWRNHDGTSPVVWESWQERSRDTMVFFEEDQDAFSLLTVLQMGRNYEQNRDGFVYVYSPNGHTDGTMNELVMFRVPKTQILLRDKYEFFSGRTARGDARWSRDIRSRAVVHTFPSGWVNSSLHPFAWHPSVIYNAPLGLYLMANWGMGCGARGEWFAKPSYLGFWTAPTPWGPWRQIHEELAWLPGHDVNARAYEPQIAPKWLSADGKSFWLVWTDFQVTDMAARQKALDEYQHTHTTSPDSEAEVVRSVTEMRRYKPYYSFNAQRVDLTIL